MADQHWLEMLRTTEIDDRVRPLVEALNAAPPIWTWSSCGGHANAVGGQAAAGEFYVDFHVDQTVDGWSALAAIAQVLGDIPATLTVWYDSGARFDLRGRDWTDPNELADNLRAAFAVRGLSADSDQDTGN